MIGRDLKQEKQREGGEDWLCGLCPINIRVSGVG